MSNIYGNYDVRTQNEDVYSFYRVSKCHEKGKRTINKPIHDTV